MSKITFLWSKHTNTNKEHICFGCMRSIKLWQRTRHDVWKEWKTVVNKYYCQDCETLLDSQLILKTQSGKPYNPLKWEIMQRFPQYFQYHFLDKYNKDERLDVLQHLQIVFSDNLEIVKYHIARMFGAKRWHKFDHEDYKEFARTYKYTKHFSYFICSK